MSGITYLNFLNILQSCYKSSWSYIDTAPADNTEANPITGQSFVPGTFQECNKDYFNDYFIIQKFTTGGITEIDRQLRYGRFRGGNEKNFSETFLRGVRIIAKPKAIGSRSLILMLGHYHMYKMAHLMIIDFL